MSAINKAPFTWAGKSSSTAITDNFPRSSPVEWSFFHSLAVLIGRLKPPAIKIQVLLGDSWCNSTQGDGEVRVSFNESLTGAVWLHKSTVEGKPRRLGASFQSQRELIIVLNISKRPFFAWNLHENDSYLIPKGICFVYTLIPMCIKISEKYTYCRYL